MGDNTTSQSPNFYSTTKWTQILDVIQRDQGEIGQAALAAFCRQYRLAIYNFFRHHGRCDHEQAEDLTHKFLETRIFERLEGRDGFLHRAKRNEHTKFRSFLANVLWKFLRDERRHARSQKAGGGALHEPLEGLDLPDDEADPKPFKEFGSSLDREVALVIIRKSAERSKHSECLEAHLRGEVSQKEAAARLGLSENAFKQAYLNFRRRLAKSLWDEVAKLVGPNEDEVRAEIRYLISLFAHPPA